MIANNNAQSATVFAGSAAGQDMTKQNINRNMADFNIQSRPVQNQIKMG